MASIVFTPISECAVSLVLDLQYTESAAFKKSALNLVLHLLKKLIYSAQLLTLCDPCHTQLFCSVIHVFIRQLNAGKNNSERIK